VAMAAPTPISSLVHSSTLVTAGLYLIIRNFSYLSYQQEVLNLLLIVGGFTSLYAGLSSVVEVDLKKVVALSTLRHLGFICFALGLGWSNLAFFHLLSHAFFKSRLFMAIGGYIRAFRHYQDSRVFSSLFLTNPYFSFVALISEFNLLGLPFLRGFYSKDLVLESMASHPASVFILTLAYINVILTFTYRFRILYSVISSSKLPVFNTPHCPPPSYILLLSLLSLFSILFGVYFTTVLPPPLFWVPSVLKLAPIVLVLLCGFTFLILTYSSFNTLRVKMLVLQSLSRMFSMGSLWGSLSSKGFLVSSQSRMRSVESGLLLSSVVGFRSALLRYTSTLISYPLLWSFQFSILYICIIFLVYIMLAGV
jgi:NADH-ubiquinone oxidoreductase chain 5